MLAILRTLGSLSDRKGTVEVSRGYLWDVHIALGVLESHGDINDLHPAQFESLKQFTQYYLSLSKDEETATEDTP